VHGLKRSFNYFPVLIPNSYTSCGVKVPFDKLPEEGQFILAEHGQVGFHHRYGIGMCILTLFLPGIGSHKKEMKNY
jgi:hypothetical protein